MDPNPKNFPILSFVMSKVASTSPHQPPPEFDVEQPDLELNSRMPHLSDPKVVSAMRLAVSNVSQARSALRLIGTRPDHEAVDIAKAKVEEINAYLGKIALSPPPGLNAAVQSAEEERRMYKAVVDFDEMWEAYEGLLRDAERKLERIYEVAVDGGDFEAVLDGDKGVEMLEAAEELNPEVERIVKEVHEGKVVENVDLSNKKLRVLKEGLFDSMKMVVSLNLSANSLQDVPESIGGLQKLEELYLSSNVLESLPDSIGLLINLKILDVSRNKLVELPVSICHCRSLVELNASFNRLAYLPTNIGYELLNLRKLFVQLNKLRSLPTSIGEMKSLQLLDAHFNELNGLPISMGKLINLEVLNLCSNFSDLSELPHTIGDLSNLKELDLSNNQIHELPDTFGLLHKLVELNLDHNPLIIPPKEVVVKGVEAVKHYMGKRRVDLLVEEHNRRKEEEQMQQNLLTRSTSWLRSVSGYLSPRKSSAEPSYLDQEL